jgi:uncharacterized protein YciI
MIYFLTSEITSAPEDIGPFIDDHFAYLDRYHRAGTFLLSGAMDPPSGAVIVAQGDDRAAIERIAAEDPLVKNEVVAVTITAIDPGRVHPGLAGPLGVAGDKVRG